jgi:hypothetical protein
MEAFMNSKNLTQKIRAAGVAFFLLFGIGILSATTANAQNDRRRDNDDNRRNDRRNDDDRYDNDRDDDDRYDRNDRDNNNRNWQNNSVMQQAYRNGFSEGSDDARRGRRSNAQRAAGQAMRRMNNGNNSRWGNQRNFRQEYRDAFIRGYEEGFDRNDDRNDRRRNRNRRNGY